MKNLIFVILIFLTNNIYSQIPTWTKIYSHTGYGNGKFVINTFDGGFAVTGGYVVEQNISKIYLLKIDINGNIEWEKIYSNGESYCVRQTSDSGFVLSGWAENSFLLKADKNGNFQWMKSFNQLLWTKSFDITNDSGFILCGEGNLAAIDSRQGCILKTDRNGNYIWHKYINDSLNSSIIHIYSSNDDCYYYSGLIYKINLHNYAIIGKINSSGSYNKYITVSPYLSGWYSISNPVYISGNKFILNYKKGINYVYSYHIIKIDSSLNILQRKDTLKGYDIKYLCKLNENSFIAAGFADFDIRLIYMDANCNILKTVISSPTNDADGVYHIARTNDNGLIYTGLSEYPNGGLEQILVVKTDSNGSAPPIGIKKINNIIQNEFNVSQNFPNPFNNNTEFIISIINSSKVNFEIFNSIGELINCFTKFFPSAGKYKININLNHYKNFSLPSGIYFLSVNNNHNNKILKLMYVK